MFLIKKICLELKINYFQNVHTDEEKNKTIIYILYSMRGDSIYNLFLGENLLNIL